MLRATRYGEHNGVGRNWIFYDEIRLFGAWIDVGAEPLVLPLLGAAHNVPRRLVIATSHWLPNYQREFRRQLKVGLTEGRAAYKDGRPERPWIFFFGQEKGYDQIEFSTGIQPGVELLVRAMPRLRWDYRPSDLQEVRSQRPPSENAGPESPLVDAITPDLEPAESHEPTIPAVEAADDRPSEDS